MRKCTYCMGDLTEKFIKTDTRRFVDAVGVDLYRRYCGIVPPSQISQLHTDFYKHSRLANQLDVCAVYLAFGTTITENVFLCQPMYYWVSYRAVLGG